MTGRVLQPWVTHFGLTRTPFGKNIAAANLFTRDAHAEAVARIHHCVHESALGVITGEVGAGKTVAVRAAVPRSTPPDTTSSTSRTPPSEPAGSTSPSSPRSAPHHGSTKPKSCTKPPPCSRTRKPNVTDAP